MHLRDGLQTRVTVAQRYDHLIGRGEITRDAAQERLVRALDRLIDDLCEKRIAAKSSSLGWLFAKRRDSRAPVRGLYIHGGVGRGKTMLMDMFFELVPARRKRRVHFNAFMADAHDRINQHRQALKRGETREDDPIPPVARALADEAWVLCFDEFAVTDIADAMILSRLFSALFASGVVLIATSNVAPDDLYRDGLNRALFTPFIKILKQHTDIFALDAEKDYRLEQLDGMPVYMTPADPAAERMMDRAWEAMTRGARPAPDEIAVKGRHVAVPRAAGRTARFSFRELCEAPLGARDYLAIAGRYDTIFIDGIPVLAEARRNEAKRLILLVDTLYDHGARLVVSAEAPPAGLYGGRTGTEAFEFERTASRLIEMQGKDWLDAWSERHAQGQAAAAAS
jgi:cell division protein ZapE